MTRLINIPIPAELAEDMAQVLRDIKTVCPKHGDDGKRVVAIDQCQWELLKLLERIGHGLERYGNLRFPAQQQELQSVILRV